MTEMMKVGRKQNNLKNRKNKKKVYLELLYTIKKNLKKKGKNFKFLKTEG